MSTTFGIEIKGIDEPIEIARRVARSGGAFLFFTNPLAELLSDDQEVLALDNSRQGIETIGDIKEAIKNNPEE